MNVQTPAVSVVITTHNEGASIKATLLGLTAQTDLPSGGFEVVLVDDRSTDDTFAEATAAGLDNLRILHNHPDPASALTTRQQALDMGFKAAKAAVILTLDADCRVAPTWLRDISASILSGQADAVGAPIGFAPADHWVARWQNCDVAYYFLICAILARFGASAGVFFGNFAFAARRYHDLGGFDAIGFALTEDLAFAQALQKDGARIRFQRGPLAVVRPCADYSALVDRSLRITAGKFSALAAVLTGWALSLILCLILALICPGFTGLLILRYLLGVTLVSLGHMRHGRGRLNLSVFTYEPIAFLIAFSALWRMTTNKCVSWGGTDYGR
jgi:glycosyltransferase involved in cell wall biosynthesis